MALRHFLGVFVAAVMVAAVMVAAVMVAAVSDAAAQSARPDPADREAVRTVIVDQMSAFRADDAERAYSFAAPGIRRMFPTADVFMDMVRRGYRPVYRAENPLFTNSRLLGEGRIVQEVLLTGPDGNAWTAVYTLERQPDGLWRITGCSLKESGGEAA